MYRVPGVLFCVPFVSRTSRNLGQGETWDDNAVVIWQEEWGSKRLSGSKVDGTVPKYIFGQRILRQLETFVPCRLK